MQHAMEMQASADARVALVTRSEGEKQAIIKVESVCWSCHAVPLAVVRDGVVDRQDSGDFRSLRH